MIRILNFISNFFFYVAFFFSILWDLYHPILGKIFDIFGYFFLFLAVVIKVVLSKKIIFRSDAEIIWQLPFIIISIFSAFYFPLISSSVFLGVVCTLCVPVYFSSELRNLEIYTFVKFLFLFLFVSQLIQIVFHFAFGYNIDFGGSIGFNNSRNEGGDFFRASGLLAEGNAIVVTQSILYILLNIKLKNNTITYCYLISIIISFSMLGVGIAIFLFLILQLYEISKFKIRRIISLIALLALLLVVFNQLGYLTTVFDIYKFRLDSDSNDISLYLRLFRPSLIPFYEFAIPHSYDIENEIVPSNAYFIGLYFWGVFFIYFFIRLLYLLKFNLIESFIFLAIFLSYQMYSSLLFWIFVSFLISNKSSFIVYNNSKIVST